MSSDDKFKLIGKVPAGKAYQWVAIAIMGDSVWAAHDLKLMKEAGWKPVPHSRHRKMKRKGNHIVVNGQMLMENTIENVKAARDREVAKARAMFETHPARVKQKRAWSYDDKEENVIFDEEFLGFDATYSAPRSGLSDYSSQLSVNKIEFEECGGVFPVSLKIKLSEREIDAAAVVGLSLTKYAQNKVEMIDQLFAREDPCVLQSIGNCTFQFARLHSQLEPLP